MNKSTFIQILQSALLNYDNMTYEELLENGASPVTAATGIKLCEYLKQLPLKEAQQDE